ncbi:MAG TPA: hypothetical protein DD412_05085 [Holosporales bacterium]|nr:hypothetical protein [Holosporales bacterium]
MRAIFAILFSVLSIFSVDASPQDTLKTVPKDSVLITSFTQNRHLSSIPTPLISTGTLKLWPQKGLIWATEHSFPSTLIISKSGLYQIENGQPKVLEKATQSDMVFKILSAILAGNFLKGLEGFDITLVSQDKSQWHVKLAPQNSQIKNFITAFSIQGHEQIQRITICRANGDYDDIVFTNHKIAPLKKALSSQELRWLND